ncbi:MAG: class I SAM-dependent DNA methyltransferase [Verrucomicrobiota bacterium]
MTSAQTYFDRHARAFDRVYEGGVVNRLLRPGPGHGRDLAASVVARHPDARILDVGCGPGRVAEAVLLVGASGYVGIDISPRMLDLARRRLSHFDAIELLEGDFLAADVPGRFDVVLALGLFDYVTEPARAAAWLHARCSSTLVASFTRRDPLKAPIRRLRYRIGGVPVVDYTEAGVQALLRGAGFRRIEVPFQGRRGFHAVAAASAVTPLTDEDRARPATVAY